MTDQQGSSESGSQGGGEKPPLADNPPGYVPPGQGLEDLAGADHAIRKSVQRMQEIEQRTQAVSGSSGGFKFDLEAMRALTPEWKDIARRLRDFVDKAERLGRAEPPAPDDASVNQIESVYDHARICIDIHNQMFQYAFQYADGMEKAVKRIEESDQAAHDTMRDAGKEV